MTSDTIDRQAAGTAPRSAEPAERISLAAALRARVETLGGVELEPTEREPIPTRPEPGR